MADSRPWAGNVQGRCYPVITGVKHLRDLWGQDNRTQRAAGRGSHWSKMQYFEHE